MNWWKIVFAFFVAALGLYLGFLIISYLTTIIWYLFIVGILGLVGYGGYKYLTSEKEKDVKEIEGVNTISQAELENAKIVNELEELKRRLHR